MIEFLAKFLSIIIIVLAIPIIVFILSKVQMLGWLSAIDSLGKSALKKLINQQQQKGELNEKRKAQEEKRK